MNKYVLLGTYDTRDNVEVIKESDLFVSLKRIQMAINNLNHHMRNRDRDKPCPGSLAIIKTFLFSIDIKDEDTGYVHEINPIGIFELKEVA